MSTALIHVQYLRVHVHSACVRACTVHVCDTVNAYETIINPNHHPLPGLSQRGARGFQIQTA